MSLWLYGVAEGWRGSGFRVKQGACGVCEGYRVTPRRLRVPAGFEYECDVVDVVRRRTMIVRYGVRYAPTTPRLASAIALPIDSHDVPHP